MKYIQDWKMFEKAVDDPGAFNKAWKFTKCKRCDKEMFFFRDKYCKRCENEIKEELYKDFLNKEENNETEIPNFKTKAKWENKTYET